MSPNPFAGVGAFLTYLTGLPSEVVASMLYAAQFFGGIAAAIVLIRGAWMDVRLFASPFAFAWLAGTFAWLHGIFGWEWLSWVSIFCVAAAMLTGVIVLVKAAVGARRSKVT